MKYFLELRKKLGGERVLINILSRHPRSFGSIQGIIDTGSPRTIISVADAMKLNIPIKNLPNAPALRGFGRGGIPAKELKNFVFLLKNEEGKTEQFKRDVLVADFSTLSKMSREYQEHAYRVPTIIGLDLLITLKMKLVVNFENDKEAFLESI